MRPMSIRRNALPREALVNHRGDIAVSGKAPSKRFAVYVYGAGARSNTVTVTAR